MKRSMKFAVVLFALVTGSFAAGLYTLFALRFEQGDVYPPYSSLRSDPLGVKALYEALERILGISVTRHYRDLTKLTTQHDKTIFVLGLAPDFLTQTEQDLASKLEALAKGGARLVLAFRPGQGQCRWRRLMQGSPKREDESMRERDGAHRNDNQDRDQECTPGHRSAAEKWQVTPEYQVWEKDSQRPAVYASLKDAASELPAAISVHTPLYFSKPGPGWCVLYAVDENPVIIEHPFGAGAIVLVADSYLFSNEALLKERHPALIAWMVGGSSTVVFDEFHLGVSENPGVMSLARQYRLHGCFVVLLLLAGLFIWQRAVPFPPSCGPVRPHQAYAAGKDHLNGLINLLKRNIEPSRVLKTCFEEWQRSFSRSCRDMDREMQLVRAVLEAQLGKSSRDEDVVAGYRKIVEILAERKFR